MRELLCDRSTVVFAPTWNAVRMYWVRTKGRSCLESTALNTSMNISLNFALASSGTCQLIHSVPQVNPGT